MSDETPDVIPISSWVCNDPPAKPEWYFTLSPFDDSIKFMPTGRPPRWIHRVFQRIFLGIRWKRIEDR